MVVADLGYHELAGDGSRKAISVAMVLLVRNRVKDIDRWKGALDGDAARGAAAGLTVLHVWRSVDASDEVFFLLGVEDRDRAEAFMALPESAAVGVEAGVLDGEVHFLEELPP